MKLKTINIEGNIQKEIDANYPIFTSRPHKQAMFDAVISETASTRQGTHSTLKKGEVRGGGKKPWMQKHTGKARQGSTRNPHWVGGGVAHGPKPTRNYSVLVNRQAARLAFSSAISTKINDIFILDNFKDFTKPTTKNIVNFLNNSKTTSQKVLFIMTPEVVNFFKSTSNVEKVTTKVWNKVSVKDILNSQVIVIQKAAADQLLGGTK
jgi:large subunit ribosomal protein L4